MLGMAPALPHIKAGKLKGIAVTGRTRSGALPEVPTVAESGVPGFETGQWQGIVAPAGTQKSAIGAVSAAPSVPQLHAAGVLPRAGRCGRPRLPAGVVRGHGGG